MSAAAAAGWVGTGRATGGGGAFVAAIDWASANVGIIAAKLADAIMAALVDISFIVFPVTIVVSQNSVPVSKFLDLSRT
ncbi:hypothetical protein [Sphingomonas sp. RS2018]